MKLLVASDIHINDWLKFSELDSAGRPTRLMQYLQLANDIKDLAIKDDCDAIILAGDISEKCVQRPRVLDVIGDFIRILAKAKPVHLIHGQHDCDTKQTEIMYQNSILKEICKDLDDVDVHYYGEPEVIELGSHKIAFQPWTDEHAIPNVSADVFVGHGLVCGTENLDGHIFNGGFQANDLTDRFRLSIIGDIHNGQVVQSKTVPDRKILIPGSPIQNTWKDAHNCGIWTAEITGVSDEPVLKFFNIHELNPNCYHQFVYDQESTDLIHSRPLIRKTKEKTSKSEIKIERNLDTIFDTCLAIVDEDKVKNPIRVRDAVREAFDNIKVTEDKVITNSEILGVDIKNFLSVDEFSIKFDEFSHSCVIVGKNGTGKTSLPEAIYWCLTGTTTKDIPVSNIVNNFKEEAGCEVSVHIGIGKSKYIIRRSREGSSSSLEVESLEGNIFKRGSIRETQQDIYDLLGLTDWQIKMFSYFSAQKTSLFAGLGDSAKNDLLSQIVGLNFLEFMRDYSKAKKNSYKEQILKSQGCLGGIDYQINSLTAKLSKLSQELNEENNDQIGLAMTQARNNVSKIKHEFQEKALSRSNMLKEVTETYDVMDLKGLQDHVSMTTKEASSIQSQISQTKTEGFSIKTALTQKKSALKEAISGVCYTCTQPLNDDTLILSLKDDIRDLVSQSKELPCVSVLQLSLDQVSDELERLHPYVTDLLRLNSDMEKKKNELEACNNELKSLTLELQKEKQDNSILEHVRQELKDAENEKAKQSGLLLDSEISQDVWKYIETDLLKKKGKLIRKLNQQGSILIQKCVDELVLDAGFQLKITDELKISGKFYNGKWISYEALSSGQKRVVDITLMVAMNNLFSKIYNLDKGVLGLTVYDEILSFLDEEYIEVSKGIVDQSMSKKVLIITHDPGLINMYDSVIKVSMSKNGSIYQNNWS